jgi:hypothetical protein
MAKSMVEAPVEPKVRLLKKPLAKRWLPCVVIDYIN